MLRKAGDLSRENWSEISLSMFGERKTSSRMPRQAAVVVAGAPNLLRSLFGLLLLGGSDAEGQRPKRPTVPVAGGCRPLHHPPTGAERD